MSSPSGIGNTATEPTTAGTWVTRYKLWTADPLDPDDEQPIFGTFSLASAQRIIDAYNRKSDCHRVMVIRPVEIEVPTDHPFFVQSQFCDGRREERHVMAADTYAAARWMQSRQQAGIAGIAVWLFEEDLRAGAEPLIHVSCDAVPVRCPEPALPAAD